MTIETGDRYLALLSSFIEENTGPLLDGGLQLKLNPLGLSYVQSRLEALAELEDLRIGAPVDYLRAYVADLGDHRALEQLRRVLRLLTSVKVVATIAGPTSRDPTTITLLPFLTFPRSSPASPFSRLRSLELRGCDLSTTSARGLLELHDNLERLVCYNSADALRHIFSERTKDIQDGPRWSRLVDVSCFGNGMLLMDESLQLLPAVETLDLSRNRFAKVANLHKCSKLKFLDVGFNHITTVASLNKDLRGIVKVVLRNNALVSVRGLHRIATLEALDLSFNLISSFREVESLGKLPSLRFLWLQGNPITFCRYYRREVLSYFPDPAQLVLDGKETSKAECRAAKKLAATRVKQSSKYGAFAPARRQKSSDSLLQRSDSDELEDLRNKWPSSVSAALQARKKNSRLASILDVSELQTALRAVEPFPDDSFSLSSGASLDSNSAMSSLLESKEQIEETVRDLRDRAEGLKRTGSSSWLKDLNSLLQSEVQNKTEILEEIQKGESNTTQMRSSLRKRSRKRSVNRKSSFSDSGPLVEESEGRKESCDVKEAEMSSGDLTREGSLRRMSRDNSERFGSGSDVGETSFKGANFSGTSLGELRLLDKERPQISPNYLGYEEGKLPSQSEAFKLTEELVTGKMNASSSASPPQFHRDLLHRRETLERERLQLPPEVDFSIESESSSGSVISDASDSSDSLHRRESVVWYPFKLDHDQTPNLARAPSGKSGNDEAFQAWSDTEGVERDTSEHDESPSGVDHVSEGEQLRERSTSPTDLPAQAAEAPDDEKDSPHLAKNEDENPDRAQHPEECKQTHAEDVPPSKATEAEREQFFSTSNSTADPSTMGRDFVDQKNDIAGEERLNTLRHDPMQSRFKSSRRVVRLDSLPGVSESSISERSPRSRNQSVSIHRRSMSSGVSDAAGRVLPRSLSSSVQYSKSFSVAGSSSGDVEAEKQREWSRSKNQEDSFPSSSLQTVESH